MLKYCNFDKIVKFERLAPTLTPFANQVKFGMLEMTNDILYHAKFCHDRYVLWYMHFQCWL